VPFNLRAVLVAAFFVAVPSRMRSIVHLPASRAPLTGFSRLTCSYLRVVLPFLTFHYRRLNIPERFFMPFVDKRTRRDEHTLPKHLQPTRVLSLPPQRLTLRSLQPMMFACPAFTT